MIPLAFDRRPSRDVPIVLLALTTNDSVSLAVASGASDRPKSTRRLEVFVQVPVTETPSRRRRDSDTSSPKARGMTDRLIEVMRSLVVLRMVMVSDVVTVPVA
jgi:hypothetical protein